MLVVRRGRAEWSSAVLFHPIFRELQVEWSRQKRGGCGTTGRVVLRQEWEIGQGLNTIHAQAHGGKRDRLRFPVSFYSAICFNIDRRNRGKRNNEELGNLRWNTSPRNLHTLEWVTGQLSVQQTPLQQNPRYDKGVLSSQRYITNANPLSL